MKILFIIFFHNFFAVKSNYNINDDVLYGISWKDEEIIKEAHKGITILSKDKESYHCILPKNVKDKFDNSFDSPYTGSSETELLKPLLNNKLCSVKIESYWTYEICHGRYVRQFHEDSVQGKQIALQEYSLGLYQANDLESLEHPNKSKNRKELPTVTINSVNFPYFRVNMTDGTKCDLIGQSRSINILYICQSDGRGEIYEIHEVRTCEYQAIVFTRLLCSHPGYKVTDNHVNEISCYPLNGADEIPKSLSMLHDEMNSESNSISTLDGLFNEHMNVGSQIKVEAYKENGVIVYRIKAFGKQDDQKPDDNIDSNDEKFDHLDDGSSPDKVSTNTEALQANKETPKKLPPPISSSTALLHRFLSGKFCVDGGEGWWRHRVCYNRKISQYHLEMHLETAEIILGLWKEDKHKEWLERNLDKKPTMPVEDRMEIYQYFTEGNFCDEIKANRDAVLRIKCVKDNSSSIMISFLEPRTCSYIVTIESSLFCSMIREADEFGLVKHKDE